MEPVNLSGLKSIENVCLQLSEEHSNLYGRVQPFPACGPLG